MREKARRTELNGLELVYLADGIYVRSVVEGSSFLGGRLQKGDKIVAVAGKSVEGMDMDRFYDLVHAVKEEVKANRRLREGPAFVVTVVRTSFGDKPTAPMDIYLNKEAFFSELYDVDDEDFDGVASGSGVSVFIFWKPQCAECVKSVPVAEKIAVVRKSQLKAYSMNTAENPETVQKLQIEAVPVILVYSEGKMVARLDGVQTEQSLEKVLVPLLGLPYAAPRGGGR
jgi:thiol-disulfide isomerase/thioredoxin